MTTTRAEGRIRVGVVDDHAVVRDGTAALLERESDIEVVGVADTLDSAAALLELRPDVLVVDIRLGQENGLSLLRGLTSTGGPAVVILTSFDYPQFVDAALRLGASGYVLKTDPFANLVHAIRQVAAGGVAYSVRPSPSGARRLSPRELEIVSLVVAGRSNDEIAHDLGISAKTVESHLTRIYEHANVTTRTELAARAIREGWLEGVGE
jgi:two-component system, NarL family, nitrate/nitrite response regulator NarL